MSEVVIRCERLGKQYRIEANGHGRYVALRDVLTEGAKSLGRRLLGRALPADLPYEEIWALKEVSFEMRRGDCVGVIGHNGAGKSTLLKLLSRITEPTTGRIQLRGRVASLLDVGTGFHPELTGRENIYLNGAILGMRRGEIKRKFDEIVAFAEIEKFLETPVKRYSSGMYMRLAFAVAAHLEPEILIVDEVLAVGDVAFQKKCLGKISDVARAGRTVLFVSHNMAAVQKLCSRALVLDRGEVLHDSTANEAIREYLGIGNVADGKLKTNRRQAEPQQVQVADAWLEVHGMPTGALLFGDQASLFLDVEVLEPGSFAVELVLRQEDGLPVAFAPSGLAADWEVAAESGHVLIRCGLPPARYACGRYSIDIVLARTGLAVLEYIESAISFEIDGTAIGSNNWCFSQSAGQGSCLWDVSFRVEPRRSA